MKKKRGRKKNVIAKAPMQEQQAPPITPVAVTPRWQRLKDRASFSWRILLELIAVASVIGLYSLMPRVTVYAGQTLDTSSPFATPFGLRNDGMFPIAAISFACGINNWTDASGTRMPVLWGDKGVVGFVGLASTEQSDTRLEPTEAMEFLCPQREAVTVRNGIGEADISLFASFNIPYIPWRFVRCVRFATRKESSGSLRWLQRPFGRPLGLACDWPKTLVKWGGPTTK